jgi:hypothetical protein
MKGSARYLGCVLVFLLSGLFISPNAFSQVTATASLTGTILDKSGSVVPGAKITLINKGTGDTRTTTSGSNGLYRFDLLAAGTYNMKTTKEGFATSNINDIVLYVGQTTSEGVTLSPGAVSQTITVTSAAPLIEATKSDVGMTITPTQVQSMPLNGRDFANLAELAPGARAVNPYDPTKRRYSTFAINGSSGRNVMVEVNGIDDKDNTIGGPVMQLPLSAVQEFSIATQRFSAANGRSEGGAVNVITKSGTNAFHGGLYLFDTETSLNANDYFSKQGNQPTPQFSRQQFGGDIGGPIRKDKDFFFFALERSRENTSIPVTPTAFQELSLAKSIGAEPANAIPTPFHEWRYNARLDHRFNANNSASLVYNAQKNNGENDQSGNENDLTAGNFTTNSLILASFNLNSVLSSHVVNSFTAGYQYWNNLIDTSKYSQYTVSFPSGTYFGTNINVPQESIQKKWQFKDDVSVIHGNHTIRTGVDFLWEPVLGGFFKYNAVPNVVFLQDANTILNDKTTYPDGFATAGLVGEIFATTNGDPYFNLPGGDKQFGAYIQDDWQATHSFTFNLGLRWDRDFNLIGGSAQNINRTYLLLRAIGSPYANRLPTDDNHGWGPRIGFAWDVHGNSKHVIRGGYGLYFGQTFLNIPLFMIQQSNPTLFGTAFDLVSTGPNDTNAPLVPGTGLTLNEWQFGVSPFPTIPPPASTLSDGATGRIMSPTYRNPYSEQWNFGYAFQPDQLSVIEVEYVHELGVHEGDRLNINPTLTSLGGGRPLDSAFAAANLPILGPIVNDESAGRSRYDALNVSYRRKMSHHFTINTNYVLSRAMAYDGSSAAFANYPINPLAQWSPVDFGPTPSDQRHSFTFSGIFQLPWSIDVAPILVAGSARPYNATQGINVFGFGARVSAAHAFVLNSDPSNLTATKGYSPDQLIACQNAGTCYQLPYDALRGQAFFQLDKTIRWREHYNLQLFFQGFDITNRANFGSTYTGNIQSGNFGKPNGYITPDGAIVPKSFRGEFGFQFSF